MPSYAVAVGRITGIFKTWNECEMQVKGFKNAIFKKFKTEEEAQKFITEKGNKVENIEEQRPITTLQENSYSRKKNLIIPKDKNYILDNDGFVVIYIYGFCHTNERNKSMAGIGVYFAANSNLNVSKPLTGPVTGNTAEIQAAITALEVAQKHGFHKVVINTKSDFVIKAACKWKNSPKNYGWKGANEVIINEDILKLDKLTKDIMVKWNQIKAHTDVEDNGTTHKLQNNKAERQKCEHDEGYNDPICNKLGNEENDNLIIEKSDNIVDRREKVDLMSKGSEKRKFSSELNSSSKRLKLSKVNDEDFTVTGDGFLIIYTDGSCISNGKRNPKAGFGVYFGKNSSLNVSEPVIGRATNNTAEIQAAICALEVATKFGFDKVQMNTDSMFMINSVTKWVNSWKKKGWKKADGKEVVNKEDFMRLDEISKGIIVKWNHIKAHIGIEGNEAADILAKGGAERYVRQPQRKEMPFYSIDNGRKNEVLKLWSQSEKQIEGLNNSMPKEFEFEDTEMSDTIVDRIEDNENNNTSKKQTKKWSKEKLNENCTVKDDGYLEIYTDGCTHFNGRDNFKAGYGVYFGENSKLNISKPSVGRAIKSTAEIQGAIAALRVVKKHEFEKLLINTDSEFLIKSVTLWMNTWKKCGWKKVDGSELINKVDFIKLDELSKGIKIKWNHIKEKKNSEKYKAVHELAEKGARKYASYYMPSFDEY